VNARAAAELTMSIKSGDQGGSPPGGEPRPSSSVPVHVGIIMDGNGRWAAERGFPRVEGHRRGVEALRRAVRAAIDLGVRFLTVYSFSSENWARPAQEISDLMRLLRYFVRNDLADLHRNAVRVRIIGSRAGLPADICGLLDEAEGLTRDNAGLTLVVAFNYGGRQELATGIREIARKVAAGLLTLEQVTPAVIADHLDTAGIPDPDLVIRTSGEQRLSNFLLWQTAYAELVFLPLHWPDFDRTAFEGALAQFGARERRFGGIASAHPGAPLTAKTGS
jgi:undecaprenyl diphosphate synthase